MTTKHSDKHPGPCRRAIFALITALLVLPSAAAAAPALTAADEEAAARNEQYREGRKALDESRWSDAVGAFDKVITDGATETDAALYWKAYALHKLDRDREALAALDELQKDHPGSRWRDDARALTVEIRPRRSERQGRREVGYSEPIDEEEQLKLVALNALMNSDSDRAVEALEKLLDSDSPRLRERALFVLGQSDSPRGFSVLASVAKGEKHPELREEALRMLGLADSPEASAILREVYASTADRETKGVVLQGMMHSDDIAGVKAVLAEERDPELRILAIRVLGHMDAIDELAALYRQEKSLEVRKEIVRGFFIADAVDPLIEVARSEADEELRREAIRGLGHIGSGRAIEAARSFYNPGESVEIRTAVLDALFMEEDAEGLIALARRETDPELRREIIRRLSHIDSDEALDYMMEILEQ